MGNFNSCLRNGKLSFGDDFKKVVEVTRLFGLAATKLPFHSCFNIPNEKDSIAWLVTEDGGLDKKTNGQWHNIRTFGPESDEHGWNEILTISEFNDAAETTLSRIENELAKPRTRYVFWRESRLGVRWYKFYGVFEIDAEATRNALSGDCTRVVYQCVSKNVACLKTA